MLSKRLATAADALTIMAVAAAFGPSQAQAASGVHVGIRWGSVHVGSHGGHHADRGYRRHSRSHHRRHHRYSYHGHGYYHPYYETHYHTWRARHWNHRHGH